jgi:hypothetical protein
MEETKGASHGAPFSLGLASFVTKSNWALARSGSLVIVRRHRLLTMQSIMLPLLTLASLLALATLPVQQQDDLTALRKCMALHPERYCRLTHAPSTVTP